MEQPNTSPMERDDERTKQKNRTLEFGIEFFVELMLFLLPFGAEQMDIPHNFWLGLSCWVVGTAIGIRMFWIFPWWENRLKILWKAIIALAVVTLGIALGWIPVRTAYMNSHASRGLDVRELNAKPIEVSLGCYLSKLPITVAARSTGYVLPLNEAIDLANVSGGPTAFYEVKNDKPDSALSWPEENVVKNAERVNDPGLAILRCEVANHGQDNVLELNMPFKTSYGLDCNSPSYDEHVVLNPLDHGGRVTFYLVNDCPVNTITVIPREATARIAGETSPRSFQLEMEHPQYKSEGFQIGKSGVDWTGITCASHEGVVPPGTYSRMTLEDRRRLEILLSLSSEYQQEHPSSPKHDLSQPLQNWINGELNRMGERWRLPGQPLGKCDSVDSICVFRNAITNTIEQKELGNCK